MGARFFLSPGSGVLRPDVEFRAMPPLDNARGKPLDCDPGRRFAACAAAAACAVLVVTTFAHPSTMLGVSRAAAEGQGGSGGGWSSKAPLGVLRAEVAAAFAGGKLYAIAGGL